MKLTMTQSDKELLLKDLCARLPYWVFVNVTDPEDNSTIYDCLLNMDILKDISGETGHLNYKPYLRPTSSMTEEEKKEYRKLQYNVDVGMGDCPVYEYFDNVKSIDWLNKNMFD